MVQVLYVHSRDAKAVKQRLNTKGWLHKDFRMAPAELQENERWKECIAVPLQCSCTPGDIEEITSWEEALGTGSQRCPYSTSLMGNHLHRNPISTVSTVKEHTALANLNLVQLGLFRAIQPLFAADATILDTSSENVLVQEILSLPMTVCPKNLELLGDDPILVVPRKALDFYTPGILHEWLIRLIPSMSNTIDREAWEDTLWEHLSSLYNKRPRVVRRGEVDPECRHRRSHYRQLWPKLPADAQMVTGPGSPTWITVTEQGIRQSFDLTCVMFSRGNITEKIRFGKMVQPGEVVLDLYAGIGYFTLPALIHGQAMHVYACEWNPDAVEALKFNLQDNGAEDRATVLVGDCRVLARQHNLVDMFDRVSLGLLPSSEGGWRTAIKALRRTRGGWLHIHGNVPLDEVDVWEKWVCWRLRAFIVEETLPIDWVIIGTHVEKVKSFAPMINHYVADIWVGYAELSPMPNLESGMTCVIRKQGSIEECEATMPAPSCALSPDGVLHQEWMRET